MFLYHFIFYSSFKTKLSQIQKISFQNRPSLNQFCDFFQYIHTKSPEKPTAKQEAAIGALVTANQNIIDLIARRYSSPSESLNNSLTKSNVIANARKNSATEVTVPAAVMNNDESQNQPQTPTSPSSPSTMLSKMSPGNIFKNFFK